MLAEGFGGVTQFPDGTIRGGGGLWDAKFAEGGDWVGVFMARCALWPIHDNVLFGRLSGSRVCPLPAPVQFGLRCG
ncbi:hypothetical protein ACHAWO_005813 [Cyclotella atomus]|uniref:Uncharacterized protein n=1 Tax=Cyclotella atomus TaxID=382360 RepID=A0ABD3P1X5_9STRA